MWRDGSVPIRLVSFVVMALSVWGLTTLFPVPVQAKSMHLTPPASGLDLGPVGQYYSQVSPYLRSTLIVFNPNSDPASYRLTVRNDVGTPVTTIQGRVEPGRTASHTLAEWGLHGIFHGELETDPDTPLAVYVHTETTVARDGVWSEYVGVRAGQRGQAFHMDDLPAATEEGWNAEVVLQNSSGEAMVATVRLCGDDGCLAQGQVHLDGYGRRIVPLDRLAFRPRADGGGIPAPGTYQVWVEAPQPVAVLVQRFRRGSAVPERGRLSDPLALYQETVTVQNPAPARPGATLPPVSDGRRLFLPLVQRPTWTERQVPLQPEFLPTDTQWVLPFLAAPNLPFRKVGPHPYAVGYPHQGIDETGRPLDAWAEFADFNWYNWKGGWYTRGESDDFCATDPDFIPMVWSNKGRNLVPSACAGRPLLLANEPVDYRRVTPSYSHWTDTYFAHMVFLHRNWPGTLYCCGYLERPGSPYEKIDADNTDFATLGNVMARYQERYGEPLPLDGIHMHVYVEGYNVDVAQGRLPDWVTDYLSARLRRWIEFVDAHFGPETPFLVSEYGALTGGPNVAENRQVVLAAMCDITRVVREGYGDRLVQMFYFDFYWGGERDPWRPMWMVGSDDGRYGIEEVNEVGQFFLEFVQAWPDYPARCGG